MAEAGRCRYHGKGTLIHIISFLEPAYSLRSLFLLFSQQLVRVG